MYYRLYVMYATAVQSPVWAGGDSDVALDVGVLVRRVCHARHNRMCIPYYILARLLSPTYIVPAPMRLRYNRRAPSLSGRRRYWNYNRLANCVRANPLGTLSRCGRYPVNDTLYCSGRSIPGFYTYIITSRPLCTTVRPQVPSTPKGW